MQVQNVSNAWQQQNPQAAVDSSNRPQVNRASLYHVIIYVYYMCVYIYIYIYIYIYNFSLLSAVRCSKHWSEAMLISNSKPQNCLSASLISSINKLEYIYHFAEYNAACWFAEYNAACWFDEVFKFGPWKDQNLLESVG